MAQQEKIPSEAFLSLRKQLNARLREKFAQKNGTSSAPASQSAVPDPLEQRAKARKEALEQEEERFREARTEYETTEASILDVAKRHGLNYNQLRVHIRTYHPESHLLHVYARHPAEVARVVSRQISEIQRLGENDLRQMSEDLSAELAKLGKKSS